MNEQDIVVDLEYLEDIKGTEDEVSCSDDPLEILIKEEERKEFYTRLKILLGVLKEL